MKDIKLSTDLRPEMKDAFSKRDIFRVQATADAIQSVIERGNFEMETCALVSKIERLDFDSITELLNKIAIFLTHNERIFEENTIIDSSSESAKSDTDLFTVAMLDIYMLICCGKSFDINENVLLGIIMLNMKFSGGNSGGKSKDNIATHITNIILGQTHITKEEIITQLKEKSGLDESKFPTSMRLNKRKEGASCPLYAFKDSSNYIKKLWELVNLIFLVVGFKFSSPKIIEELFLTGRPLHFQK